MSVRLMSAVWDLDLPPGEKLVLLALADQANDEGLQCWPSVDTIARKSGQGERTVRRALSELEEKGHLTRNHRDGDSTQYHVHPGHNGTPAKLAPLPKTTATPAKLAPKTPRTIKTSRKASASAKPAYHRLPSNWHPAKPLSENLQARVALWPPGKIDDELEAFHGWAANAKDEDGKGRKLDWEQAWGNWLRKAANDWKPPNSGRQLGFVGQDPRGSTIASAASVFGRMAR